MDFLTNLSLLINKKGINNSVLSRESGVPYTTIDGFYKRGTGDVKLSTLKKLSVYFEVPIDYLIYGESATTENSSVVLPTDEQELLNNYRQLNEEGQERLLETSEELTDMAKYKKHTDIPNYA